MDKIEALLKKHKLDPSIGEAQIMVELRRYYGDKLQEDDYRLLRKHLRAYYQKLSEMNLRNILKQYNLDPHAASFSNDLSRVFPDMDPSTREALKVSFTALSADRVADVVKHDRIETPSPAVDETQAVRLQDTQQRVAIAENVDVPPQPMTETLIMPMNRKYAEKSRQATRRSAEFVALLGRLHPKFFLLALVSVILYGGIVGASYVLKSVSFIFAGLGSVLAIGMVFYAWRVYKNNAPMIQSIMFRWFSYGSLFMAMGVLPILTGKKALLMMGSVFASVGFFVLLGVVILGIIEKSKGHCYYTFKKVDDSL